MRGIALTFCVLMCGAVFADTPKYPKLPWSEGVRTVYIPRTSFTYNGKVYSIPKKTMDVFVEQESLGKNKAQYNRDKAFTKDGYPRIAIDPSFADKFNYYTFLNVRIEYDKLIRHETIHFLFDREYFGTKSLSEDEYHFVSEMMAYMGGDGMSEREAARYIAEHEESYKGASKIAKKFLADKAKSPSGLECRDDATYPNGSTRKICTCTEPETFFAGVVMVRIVKTKKPSAEYYCRKCGGFRRGDMFDVIRTGNGIATYPAGVLPPDWDGKIYEKAELDEHVKKLLSGSDNSTKATEGR